MRDSSINNWSDNQSNCLIICLLMGILFEGRGNPSLPCSEICTCIFSSENIIDYYIILNKIDVIMI
jgi:hypothetical protein